MNTILLIISGSVAAYKSLDLIRRLRERGVVVRCIITRGGTEFVTPLSVASLSGNAVYTDLFSLKDETEMGHIRLSREANAILVAPASADILAKMASGLADDLATATLLATDKPVYVAPAMNAQMWAHKATQRNLKQLQADGVHIIPPASGDLACGEVGDGRMAEVGEIISAISAPSTKGALAGRTALVTAGPTQEPIDPVRFIGNHSSGKQGYAIAAALAAAGARVTLISGPTALPTPPNVTRIDVHTAEEMLAATMKHLPADIAVCTAAVADWRPEKIAAHKIKKRGSAEPPALRLVENPDILKTIAQHPKKRPTLVIGFAAETEKLETNARKKLLAKGCDWLLANDVSNHVFGADKNRVTFFTRGGAEAWPAASKQKIAEDLTRKISEHFNVTTATKNTRRK